MLKKHVRLIITTLVIISTVSVISFISLNKESKALIVPDKNATNTEKPVDADKNKTPGEIKLDKLIHNGKPTVVYFTSEYCRDCIQVKPIIESLEKKYTGKVNFLTVDIRKQSAISKAAIKKFKILGVPMTVFIKKDGTKLKTLSGYYPESSFEDNLTTIIEE